MGSKSLEYWVSVSTMKAAGFDGGNVSAFFWKEGALCRAHIGFVEEEKINIVAAWHKTRPNSTTYRRWYFGTFNGIYSKEQYEIHLREIVSR